MMFETARKTRLHYYASRTVTGELRQEKDRVHEVHAGSVHPLFNSNDWGAAASDKMQCWVLQIRNLFVMKSAKNKPRRKQQWPDLSSPCCAVLTTKLKAMNRFQSYTFNVLAPHSKFEFECSWIQNKSLSLPCHSSSMTFKTFIITKSFHSASNSLTHHYIGGFE